MGKWRNKGEGEGSDRPKLSDEQKQKIKEKRVKSSGTVKSTTADESRQATAPERVMTGEMNPELQKLMAENLERIKNDPTLKQYTALQKQHEASGKKHSGAKRKANKLMERATGGLGGYVDGDMMANLSEQQKKEFLDMLGKGNIGYTPGGKKGKPAQVLPKGANPDEYYTGRWRTGKKPTPKPAPEPPNGGPILRGGPMPIEYAPPYPGYYPQPKPPEPSPLPHGWNPNIPPTPWMYPSGRMPGVPGQPPQPQQPVLWW